MKCQQNLPSNADAIKFNSLSPTLARPGGIAEVYVAVYRATQIQMVGQGYQQEQPSDGHQTVIAEGNVDAVGLLSW